MWLSSRMRPARLLSDLVPGPISLAGYLACATVAVGIWRVLPDCRPLGIATGRAVAALCMLSFVVGFGIRALAFEQPAKDVRNVAALSLMVASELALLALGPSDFTPIPLIVIAVTIGAMYPPGPGRHAADSSPPGNSARQRGGADRPRRTRARNPEIAGRRLFEQGNRAQPQPGRRNRQKLRLRHPRQARHARSHAGRTEGEHLTPRVVGR